MKATNILWDVDFDEVYEHLDNMNYKNAAKAIEVSEETYANMTTEERHDQAYYLFRHSPADLDEFLGLPSEVDIPAELIESDFFDEDVSDWLSDTFGYCHEGFEIER